MAERAGGTSSWRLALTILAWVAVVGLAGYLFAQYWLVDGGLKWQLAGCEGKHESVVRERLGEPDKVVTRADVESGRVAWPDERYSKPPFKVEDHVLHYERHVTLAYVFVSSKGIVKHIFYGGI